MALKDWIKLERIFPALSKNIFWRGKKYKRAIVSSKIHLSAVGEKTDKHWSAYYSKVIKHRIPYISVLTRNNITGIVTPHTRGFIQAWEFFN